jgi:hypothetical protein
MLSLEYLCIQHVSNMSNLNKKLNVICYDKVLDYRIKQDFSKWNKSIKNIKHELNIKRMVVVYDMYFDEPCYYIFIKYRNLPDNFEYDELYRNEYDSPLYNLYYDIAKRRGLIDNYIIN